jgi:hypothetical protein
MGKADQRPQAARGIGLRSTPARDQATSSAQYGRKFLHGALARCPPFRLCHVRRRLPEPHAINQCLAAAAGGAWSRLAWTRRGGARGQRQAAGAGCAARGELRRQLGRERGYRRRLGCRGSNHRGRARGAGCHRNRRRSTGYQAARRWRGRSGGTRWRRATSSLGDHSTGAGTHLANLPCWRGPRCGMGTSCASSCARHVGQHRKGQERNNWQKPGAMKHEHVTPSFSAPVKLTRSSGICSMPCIPLQSIACKIGKMHQVAQGA